jgi:tetratricopeptide (TPR) repeat protein
LQNSKEGLLGYVLIILLSFFCHKYLYNKQLLPTNYPEEKMLANPISTVIHDLNTQGKVFLDQQRFEQALACFEQVLALDPNYLPAHLNKGQALMGLKRYAETIAHCDSLLAQPILLQKMQPAMRQNIYMAKANTLKDLAKSQPQGQAAQTRSMAIQVYEEVLLLNSSYYPALYNKAIVLGELGYLLAALTDYEAVIQLKPDYTKAHLNKANTLASLDEPIAALEIYQSLFTDPRFQLSPSEIIRCQRAKASACQKLGCDVEALQALDKARILNEQTPSAEQAQLRAHIQQQIQQIASSSLSPAIVAPPVPTPWPAPPMPLPILMSPSASAAASPPQALPALDTISQPVKSIFSVDGLP